MATTDIPDLPFESLSPAAKEVASQARTTMERWIDTKIDDIRKAAQQKLDADVAGLKQEFDNVQAEIVQRRIQIDALLAGIVKLQQDIDLGDGQSLVEAAANTQKQVEAVRSELESYERRWKSVGAGVVAKLETVVKGII